MKSVASKDEEREKWARRDEKKMKPGRDAKESVFHCLLSS